MNKELIDLLNQERMRIYEATTIERSWWPIEAKYLTREQALVALERHQLIEVPREGDGWRLIGRLNGSETGEPVWLREEAFKLLLLIFDTWSVGIREKDQRVQLAVTSLYRSKDDQEKIAEAVGGYRAVYALDSSHLAGAAFDVSLRSYYLARDGDKPVSVSTWSETSSLFDPSLIQVFIGIVMQIQQRGLCNLVIEKSINSEGSTDSVAHVCVNPQLFEMQK
jgi:hypothetical protein